MANINPLLLKGIQDGRATFMGPPVMQIDITGRCNNNCIGCWVHSPFIKDRPRDANQELSFKVISELINELIQMGTQEVFLAGSGEPLLHPQIIQIISLIKHSGLKLNIITNTLLLTEEVSRLLVDAQVEMVTASIWAGDDQSYIKTHPGKASGDFYTIRDNLRCLDRLKSENKSFLPKVKTYNVICNLNYENIAGMVDFSLDVGAQDIEFQLIDTVEGQTSFLALSSVQIENVKDQLLALQKRPDVFFKDLDIYNRGEKEKELIEFPGRFCRVPPGFLLKESIKIGEDGQRHILRTLSCKNNQITSGSDKNPEIDESKNTMIFKFGQENCQSCKFFGSVCPVDKQQNILFKYLKIVGYGSFMRKLISPGIDEQNYEKGTINKCPCYIGWLYSRVLSTGEIIPCCKGVNKVLGNLNGHKIFSKNKFSSIWDASLYRDFRFKAKTVSKDQDYFKEINCFKSCDHFSINVALDAILKDKNSGIEGIPPSPVNSSLKLKNIIKVPANSFFRGNLNISNHSFGKGIVIDGGKGFGFAEYHLLIPEPGNYEIWVYYAGCEDRPVDLYLDGSLLTQDFIFRSSNGWDSRFLNWMYLLTVKIPQGKHIFKVYAKNLIPHIHTFTFIKND
ncbi:MAG TPA: radical SAM/SPASM domain-containing protein [Candidatus Omnitrophota bacterium]|nr:radical SAM/SPASM domain-containing protein [Candidatus Omnitrophota bacterium]